MGATYTRQSTYNDGDTITADHTNDEFDQLLAAFAASTGHTHDGTAGEGGPITKLATTSITIGDGTSGTDISVNFDGESNDGLFKWMEDEDYFEFSDDLLIASTEKIQFRDTAIYLNSSTDGQLDIVADTEIQIAATTIDMNGNVDISGTLTVAGALDFGDAALSNVGALQLDSIAGDADTNTSITFSGSDVITVATGGTTAFTVNASQLVTVSGGVTSTAAANTLGATSFNDANITNVGNIALDSITADGSTITITGNTTFADGAFNFDVASHDGSNGLKLGGALVTSTAAELNILDGVTSTAAELNILDVSNSTIGDLTEISTAANDDVIIALDTSGGGIKKITRSTFLAGSGSSSDIANVVEDTSPQLGGNLDLNGADIVTTSNASLDLAPNGTGTVVVRGNTNSGAITYNCESNSHGQKIQAQPHSASATNTMLLPEGANSTLVSRVSVDTLTNKTLTTPIANAGVQLKNGSTSAGFLEFFEDSDNGSNKVTLIGPASTADITLTLPATAGTIATTLTAADEATALAIALG